ncbi:MAG: HAD hydrolase-like protein, partial [Deltaproteobacteria bacterium]|nr:HAD hydrolase-like protein [Deltaproteobacteria bacterium]
MKKDFAVIFDCDGVMFDSRQANINFYNHLLNRFNLPAMEEKQVPFIHMHTADESVQYLFRGTPHLEEAQAYRMNMDYTPFIKDMFIEPGLIELLRWLTPKFGLAVATNRSNTIEEVIVGNGLNGFFDIVVSSLDVQNPKPHPESLFKIL